MARLRFPPAEGPYAYRSGRGFLYRLNGGIKLLFLLFLSLSSFFLYFPGLLFIALILCAAALSAGLRPWQLLRGSRPLFITVLMALAFRSFRTAPPFFSPEGFTAGLLFALRMAESFAAGALLFRVSTMTEIREALFHAERALLRPLCAFLGKRRSPRSRRLAQRLEQNRLSLALALMLGFLPRFFEIWETMSTAYDARCGKGGLSRILALIPPAAERMIEAAAETACALEIRGASGDAPR